MMLFFEGALCRCRLAYWSARARLTRPLLAAATARVRRKLRFRLVERPPRRWVANALRRFRLPEPRFLKRLAEERC